MFLRQGVNQAQHESESRQRVNSEEGFKGGCHLVLESIIPSRLIKNAPKIRLFSGDNDMQELIRKERIVNDGVDGNKQH